MKTQISGFSSQTRKLWHHWALVLHRNKCCWAETAPEIGRCSVLHNCKWVVSVPTIHTGSWKTTSPKLQYPSKVPLCDFVIKEGFGAPKAFGLWHNTGKTLWSPPYRVQKWPTLMPSPAFGFLEEQIRKNVVSRGPPTQHPMAKKKSISVETSYW